MQKQPYFLHAHLGIPPRSNIDVYTDNPVLIGIVNDFEAAIEVERFERSGMYRVHLNPQYTDERDVLHELENRLSAAMLGSVWKNAIDDLED